MVSGRLPLSDSGGTCLSSGPGRLRCRHMRQHLQGPSLSLAALGGVACTASLTQAGGRNPSPYCACLCFQCSTTLLASSLMLLLTTSLGSWQEPQGTTPRCLPEPAMLTWSFGLQPRLGRVAGGPSPSGAGG